jgi:glutamyl-tRNA synthetase
MLAGVTDDIASGVTHIIRADDSAGKTGIQIDLLEALGAHPADLVFMHLPPLTETGNRRLARRISTLSVRGLRGDGVEPLAIATCLGAGPQIADPLPLDRLVPGFDLSGVAAATTGFDAGRMLAMNQRLLSRLDFAAVADRLPDGATEAFWMAVRGNLDLLNEARGWWDVVAGSIVPPIMEEDRLFLAEAERALPPEPWDHTVWATWTAALAQATGRGEDGVTLPLRLALTGEEQGPDLDALLPLIGRTRAVNRLQVATA